MVTIPILKHLGAPVVQQNSYDKVSEDIARISTESIAREPFAANGDKAYYSL